jgi:hypothetical protein
VKGPNENDHSSIIILPLILPHLSPVISLPWSVTGSWGALGVHFMQCVWVGGAFDAVAVRLRCIF